MKKTSVIALVLSLIIHVLLFTLWMPVKVSTPPEKVDKEFNFINAVVVNQPKLVVKKENKIEQSDKVVKKPELKRNDVKDVEDQDIQPKEIVEPEETDILIENKTEVDEPKVEETIEAVPESTPEKVYIPFYKVDKRPTFLKKGELNYPEAARRKKIEGRVIVEVDIDVDGAVINSRVIKKFGFGFEEAAMEMINSSTFLPAYSKNQAVPVRMRFTINFKLD